MIIPSITYPTAKAGVQMSCNIVHEIFQVYHISQQIVVCGN